MRPIDRALAEFNPRLPRRGRLMVQAQRGLIANGGTASTSRLLEFAYPRGRKHWHCDELRRALRQLGAKEVGRAPGPGRPIIWQLSMQHDCNMK